MAAGRDTTKIKDLADRGVPVRVIDYDDPSTLDEAFRGAAKVLLISASEAGQRIRQHGHAIGAARRAGVGLVAYTSIANADTSTLRLAEEHQATEAALRTSGLPEADYAHLLTSAGMPEAAAAMIADADRGLARGDLYVGSGHLRQLIGHPTTSLTDAVAAALR